MAATPHLPTAGPFELTGRRVVITGISQGIGRATALAFAAAGAKVAGVHLADTGNDPAAGARLVDEVRAHGTDCLVRAGDTGVARTHDELAAAVVTEWGGIDVWINNAASLMVRPFLEMTDDDWHG